jgi:hypothetical protein
LVALLPQSARSQPIVLKLDDYKHYVDHFNNMEDEFVVNLIPYVKSWDWMAANVPAFECPDKGIEEIYWYRWWSYRKALKQADGFVTMTEFIKRGPVKRVGHRHQSRWVTTRDGDQILFYWLRQPPAQ